MNPFDLRGPEFLLFYTVLGAAVLLLLALRRRIFEPGWPAEQRLTDPLLIAYLRGGRNEVLRLSALGLVERGLLTARGAELEANADLAGAEVTELERRILQLFQRRRAAHAIFADGRLKKECAKLRDSLAGMGLVPDASQRRHRWSSSIAAAVLLGGVALTKIVVALARGRSNVFFLVVLAIGFTAFALLDAHRHHRTPRGTGVLRDLQLLFERARKRISGSPARAPELALLTATFGLERLSDRSRAARAKRLFPRAAPQSSTCGGGCGSAATFSAGCGSSGGSCGGGCGGGCGGCGS